VLGSDCHPMAPGHLSRGIGGTSGLFFHFVAGSFNILECEGSIHNHTVVAALPSARGGGGGPRSRFTKGPHSSENLLPPTLMSCSCQKIKPGLGTTGALERGDHPGGGGGDPAAGEP